MLIDRARIILLSLSFGLLAACGGGGGASVIAGPPPAATTGSLAISVTNLPAGVPAQVNVTGPGAFAQDISQSQSLTNLAPGAYTVTAANVVSGTSTYVPSATTQPVSVTAGASAAVTVSYRQLALTLALTEVATLPDAVFLASPPNDSRQFIVERKGTIRVLQNGSLLAAPFLDISARVSMQGEGGLLSMAFDPQFASKGVFYVYYTDLDHNIVIERFGAASATAANPGSGLVIIRIAHPGFLNHFGGLVSFGPDGMLYLGTGDGGGGGDPQRNGQNPNALLGKLLRLDVSASGAAQPYAIPSSNPFAGQAGKRGEIWAMGLRNPWRYAFDPSGLYIADVGQERREEVDIVNPSAAGLNFGWNVMEGTLCYNAATCSQAGLTLPAFDYDHGENAVNGCSITGGYVYRGKAIPELAGQYFYSDFCGGYLKSFQSGAAGVTGATDWAIADIGGVVSFGRDADGELYLIASSGKVFKIVRGAPR